MTRLMGYAQRFRNVSRALDVLRHHPDGIELDRLAAEVGTSERRLREELQAFWLADVADGTGVRQPSLEFVGADGAATGSPGAARVRVSGTDPLAELGVEVLDPAQLALLYRAAVELSALEPDNAPLAGALDRLAATLVPAAGRGPHLGPGGDVARTVREAVTARRRLEIVYARAWRPGVATRVVEPYRLVSTRRGYEVDAAALDRGGELRTFLVSGIRSARLLDETFDRPPGVEARIAAGRATTEVVLVLPADRAWVAERFSERVEVRRADEDVELAVHVVPPVADRVGLVLAIAGPGAFVVSPEDLAGAGGATAEALLRHHGLT